jgi:hypothetical protein
MGPEMDYHVGYGGDRDGMALTWMSAAGQNGIPTAFLIENNAIVWIGHPMGLDEPLRRIRVRKVPSQSPPSNPQSVEESKNEDSELRVIQSKRQCGDTLGADRALSELLKRKPGLSAVGRQIRFEWLAVDKPEVWESEARELASRPDDSGERILIAFAQSFDHDQSLSVKAMDFLVTGPRNSEFAPWFYASKVFQSFSSRSKAVAATKRAISLLDSSRYRSNPQIRTNLLKRLEQLEQG